MKNVHNIELAKTGLSMSGGETCLIEIIKVWSKENYIFNIIYTPENGVLTYQKILKNYPRINFYKIGSYKIEEKFGVSISYIFKTLLAIFHLKKFNDDNDIIISHSDFLPTLIFAYLLKVKNPQVRWLAFNHMLSPSILKGFKYQFIKGSGYKIPNLSNICYWLNQRLFFFLAKKANLLITVNSSYLDYFRRYNKNILIINYASNIENYIRYIPDIKLRDKKYDACFIGRFHEQKGIYEIIDIVIRIKKLGFENFKCIMIGNYNNKIGKKFHRMVEANDLNGNIKLVGSKTDLEKYIILNNSRILLFPSYYESFGIVYLEAISLGIPVFEYDLPIYQAHKFGAIKIPFLRNDIFAKKIHEIIHNENLYADISKAGRDYARNFSWNRTAKSILDKML